MDIEETNKLHEPFLSLPAATRQQLENAYAAQLETRSYSQESNVPGYKGWRELPIIGVTSFIRDDGSTQYEW